MLTPSRYPGSLRATPENGCEFSNVRHSAGIKALTARTGYRQGDDQQETSQREHDIATTPAAPGHAPTIGVVRRFDLQRRVVAHMVTESWTSIPHVSYLYEPDVTDFAREFDALAASQAATGTKLSFNTIVIRAIVEGLMAAPELNAHVDYNHAKGEGTLRTCDDVNVSVPWIVGDGRMITPVIPNVQSMTLAELSEAVRELGQKISHTDIDELLYRAVVADTAGRLRRLRLGVLRRIIAATITRHPVRGLPRRTKAEYYSTPEADRLTPENLVSGTVTISNIGSLYKEQRGQFGILEIIPPQVFAVGVGAMQERPGIRVTADGSKEIAIRTVLPMCLVFDHRAVDFGALIPFLKRLDAIFQAPEVVHGW